jgi:small GTP-binding protein
VEVITRGKLTMTVWDMGGQDKIRKLWRHYFHNVDAVIYVVDSIDRERIDICKEELDKLVRDPLLANAPIVVLANKQDLDEAMSPCEVAEKLDLYSLRRRWYIQPSCAMSGEGLESMLRWLSRTLS